MIRRASLFVSFALAGCAGAPRASADLESQVRELRQEQERQAHRLELLEHRVVLAEDSARLARQALVGVGARATVRIDGSGGATAEEPAPEPTPAPESGADDDGAPRPVLRAAGRERLPDSPTPFVVHDDDRLPVAPVPPDLGPSSPQPLLPRDRGRGPGSALPAVPLRPSVDGAPPVPAAVHAVAPSPGVSSVRDPHAAPAYEQALALARGGHCGEAIDSFGAFLVRWPDHPFADNAMYWRGVCMLSGGDARRAAQEFEGLLARFPVANKAPDALLDLVQCYRRLGDQARAHRYASQLLRDYPRSPSSERLRREGEQ